MKHYLAAAAFIAVIVLVSVFHVSTTSESEDQVRYYEVTAPAARMSFQYFDTNETAVVAVESGDAYKTSNTDSLRLVSSKGDILVLEADNVSETGMWVSKTEDSAAKFPVQKGSKLNILTNNRDNDGDGLSGLDGEQTIAVYYNGTVDGYNYTFQPVMVFKLYSNGKAVAGEYRGGDIVRINASVSMPY